MDDPKGFHVGLPLDILKLAVYTLYISLFAGVNLLVVQSCYCYFAIHFLTGIVHICYIFMSVVWYIYCFIVA